MTKTEAYQILGISKSAAYSKADLLYREKCKKLRLQIIPGMPVTVRQKALAELCSIETAWKTLQAHSSTKSSNPKSSRKKAARPSPVNVLPYTKPRTIAEAWEQVVSLMPFSRPVAVVIIIAVFLFTLLSLLAHF
jgi:hypothetical protein